MTLNKTLDDLISAFDKKENLKVKNLAHSLKGGACYVGAGPIFYTAQKMQELYTI